MLESPRRGLVLHVIGPGVSGTGPKPAFGIPWGNRGGKEEGGGGGRGEGELARFYFSQSEIEFPVELGSEVRGGKTFLGDKNS